MFETIANFFKKLKKTEKQEDMSSKTTAKERLHLVLMQDRANVSADFLELMKQEIIEVIKKYIEVEEEAIDVRLTNKVKEDGTTGAPFLYANIPIVNIKNDVKKQEDDENDKSTVTQTKKEKNKEEVTEEKENITENDNKESEKKQEEPIEEQKVEEENKTKEEGEEKENKTEDKEKKEEEKKEKDTKIGETKK